MSAPRVSVILPTYNRVQYLGEAIQSALDQTFRDFELVIVDDGSADATEALVRSFDDPRVRYLRRAHRGISAALNAAISESRGTCLARLDSDNVLLPDMLAVETAALDAHPAVGAVYGRATAIDAAGRPLPYTLGLPLRYPGDAFRSLLFDNFTSSNAVMFRRACLDRVGLFDEAMATVEDWDMWVRIARYYPFLFLAHDVVRFRMHDANVSGVNSPYFEDTFAGRKRVLDKAFAAPDLPARVQAMKPVAYRNMHTYEGLRRLQLGQFLRALRSFGRAIGSGPNRAVALVRILWFIVVWEVLGRHRWGRRVADGIAQLGRRLRERTRQAA